MTRIFSDFDDLRVELEQLAGHSVKAVNDGMQKLMQTVQSEAIANAPVEHGELEHAIKLENGGQRRSWAVYVDENEPDDTGKYTVGDYATRLHESTYKLGPASLEKQATNGHQVGPKYLERAFEDTMGTGAVDELNETLNDALNERYGR